MGRWAQASRSGGGPTSVTQPYTYITKATKVDNDTVLVTYNRQVTASLFTLPSFAGFPGLASPTSITQVDPTNVQLDFGVSIAADTALGSTQSAGGVLNPQTVNYT